MFFLSGCQSIAYYSQAANGQISLLAKRKAIPKVIEAPDTSEKLRDKLSLVQTVRQFADQELGLPAKRQYASYVELGREYPVWSVMASPELSLAPKTWCYWFVGCLSYRGFFKQEAAQQLADQLKAEGHDVYLSGIPAYSTLGWFRDPVLSSFVFSPDADLAELLFHELAHQLLFVKGDTVFNESFAVTVAEEGLRRFSQTHPVNFESRAQARKRREDFVALVLAYRAKLAGAYAQKVPEAEKREAKQKIIGELQTAYGQMKKEQWGGYGGYDAWFAELNNAKLNTVATYYDYVPALQKILADAKHDLPAFYAACRELAKLDAATRRTRLLKIKTENLL